MLLKDKGTMLGVVTSLTLKSLATIARPPGGTIARPVDPEQGCATFAVSRPGTYVVWQQCLAELNLCGEASPTESVSVRYPEDAGETVEVGFRYVIPQPPTCAITADPQEPSVDQPITFHANAYDPDGGPVACAWDFGDGNGSDQQHPTHQFDAGTWQVCLTVTNDCGEGSTCCQNVTVAQEPLTITCPTDVSTSNDPDECEAVVDPGTATCNIEGCTVGTGLAS